MDTVQTGSRLSIMKVTVSASFIRDMKTDACNGQEVEKNYVS